MIFFTLVATVVGLITLGNFVSLWWNEWMRPAPQAEPEPEVEDGWMDASANHGEPA